MTDPVTISNQSLLLLGQNTIQNLSENTAEAKACNTFYATARDTVLRDIKPPFVLKRAVPGALQSVPVSGIYCYAYPVPTDNLLVIAVGTSLNTGQPNGAYQTSTAWTVEGTSILSNQPLLWILYAANISGVENLMDANFIKALAAYLASEVAYAITESNNKVGAMLQLYGVRKQECENVYGQGQSTQQTYNTQLLANR